MRLSGNHYLSNLKRKCHNRSSISRLPFYGIIIRETHLTAIDGAGLGALEVVQLKNKFSQLREKSGVSIGEFKKEFDLQLDALLGAAVPATAQPELAMLFISKLDPQRYAGMLTHLTANLYENFRTRPVFEKRCLSRFCFCAPRFGCCKRKSDRPKTEVFIFGRFSAGFSVAFRAKIFV